MSDITKWKNNTYVLLSDLHDDHEVALVENSLRDSDFFRYKECFKVPSYVDSLGVFEGDAGYWPGVFKSELITRNQALKLAGVEL